MTDEVKKAIEEANEGFLASLELKPSGVAQGGLADATAVIRRRILHTLSIYPKLSMSMLQIGVGSSIPPSLWHPVFDALVEEGLVKIEQISGTHPVTQRYQSYKIIQLAA